jgi:hypothetical protein
LLFDYPTIESLTLYLAKDVLRLEMGDSAARSDKETFASRNQKELEALTECEAEALLLAELDKAKISAND